MSTDKEIRIILAEAMGWTDIWCDVSGIYVGTPPAREPNSTIAWPLPKPLNDANDCEALIKHLNGVGWNVSLMISDDLGHEVLLALDANTDLHYQGDDWKRGVCELAVKVLEGDT